MTKLEGAEARIVGALVSVKCWRESIAFIRFIQSLVWQRSRMELNSSIVSRATGFETLVVRFLKVFWVLVAPAKPVDKA